MSQTKDFDIGDVLSITTGMLLSRKHMGGIYEILNWMTGDDLMTHQLPRAMDECQEPLQAQFPQLAGIETPTFTEGASRDELELELIVYLDAMSAKYGATFPVAPLGKDEHTHINPLTELALHFPDKPVIAVEI